MQMFLHAPLDNIYLFIYLFICYVNRTKVHEKWCKKHKKREENKKKLIKNIPHQVKTRINVLTAITSNNSQRRDWFVIGRSMKVTVTV